MLFLRLEELCLKCKQKLKALNVFYSKVYCRSLSLKLEQKHDTTPEKPSHKYIKSKTIGRQRYRITPRTPLTYFKTQDKNKKKTKKNQHRKKIRDGH